MINVQVQHKGEGRYGLKLTDPFVIKHDQRATYRGEGLIVDRWKVLEGERRFLLCLALD